MKNKIKALILSEGSEHLFKLAQCGIDAIKKTLPFNSNGKLDLDVKDIHKRKWVEKCVITITNGEISVELFVEIRSVYGSIQFLLLPVLYVAGELYGEDQECLGVASNFETAVSNMLEHFSVDCLLAKIELDKTAEKLEQQADKLLEKVRALKMQSKALSNLS